MSEGPGPGYYYTENEAKNNKFHPSAPFAYQGVRSHLDELVYKTRIPFKIQLI